MQRTQHTQHTQHKPTIILTTLTIFLLSLFYPLKGSAQSQNQTQLTVNSGTVPSPQGFSGVPVGVVGGATVYYYVRAEFPAGSGPVTGPMPVTRTVGITNYTAANYVALGWTPVDGATGYTVYRSTNPIDPLIGGACAACGVVVNSPNTTAVDNSPFGVMVSTTNVVYAASGTITVDVESAPSGPFMKTVFNGGEYRLGLFQGAYNANDCVKIAANGVLQSAGAACGSGSGGSGVGVQLDNVAVGTQTTVNFLRGFGVNLVGFNDVANNRVNLTIEGDTTDLLTRDLNKAGTETFLTGTSGSGSAYAVTPVSSPLAAYSNGGVYSWIPDVTATGAHTLNVSSLGARCTYQADGVTRAGASDVIAGRVVLISYDSGLPSCGGSTGGWRIINGSGVLAESVPRATGFDNFCGPTTTVFNPSGTFTFSNTGDSLWPCLLRINTSAFNNERGGFFSSTGPYITPNVAGWDMTTIVLTPAAITNVSVGWSFGRQEGSNPTYCIPGSEQNCVGLVYASSLGANWLVRFCNASFVCTSTDTGVAVAANTYYRLRLRSTSAGTMLASVNGSAEVSLATTLAVPVAAGWGAGTLAAASNRTFWSYWYSWNLVLAGRILP